MYTRYQIQKHQIAYDENRKLNPNEKSVTKFGTVTVNPKESMKQWVTLYNLSNVNGEAITLASLLFSKINLPFLAQHMDADCLNMWSNLLSSLKLHNVVSPKTLNLILANRHQYFKRLMYIMMTLTYHSDDPLRSVMYYGIECHPSGTSNLEHFFSKDDVYRLFCRFFREPYLVPDSLCVRIDNFFMTTIQWYVRYLIEAGGYAVLRK